MQLIKRHKNAFFVCYLGYRICKRIDDGETIYEQELSVLCSQTHQDVNNLCLDGKGSIFKISADRVQNGHIIVDKLSKETFIKQLVYATFFNK